MLRLFSMPPPNLLRRRRKLRITTPMTALEEIDLSDEIVIAAATETEIGILIASVVTDVITALPAADEAPRTITRHLRPEAILVVTRVGGEAEVEMMTAVTHAVTEEQMATTT
jgi:hypothetical protein